MSWLLSLLAWVVGKLFGKPAGPSADVVEGQDLGAAQVTATAAVQAAKTETAMAQAEAQAPATQAQDVAAFKAGEA